MHSALLALIGMLLAVPAAHRQTTKAPGHSVTPAALSSGASSSAAPKAPESSSSPKASSGSSDNGDAPEAEQAPAHRSSGHAEGTGKTEGKAKHKDSSGGGASSGGSTGGGGGTCPAGMVLVEGDYCTDVQQKCLKSWYDKSNHKTVCESFAGPSRCTGRRVHKRFCIDRYEYPNRKGARPEVMNNFYQAQVKCAAQGKRVCTESEWTLACEGPQMKPFPYGFQRDPKKCNGDHPYDFPDMKKVAARNPGELARLWKGVPSGSQPQCVSDYGVADMPGNADELAASETYGGWRGSFDNVTTGGPWYKGVRNQCRPKIYTHNEGFYYYYLSFRCCAESDGKPTDPRAPKQIRRNWQFTQVERLAGIKVQQIKARTAPASNGSGSSATQAPAKAH